MSKFKKIPKELGYLSYLVAIIFRILQKLSPQVFIANRAESFAKITSDISSDDLKKLTVKRANKIDFYIIVWLVIELASVIISTNILDNCYVKYLLLTLITFRILDIVQININLSLFDIFYIEKRINYMASVVRTIVNTTINFFELIVCFGVFYSCNILELQSVKETSDAFYFSLITQVTMSFGYGDVMPVGVLRIVTCIQLLLGYFFAALILGRFISLLPQFKTVIKDGQADEN